VLAVLALACFAVSSTAQADSGTWLANPTNGDWNTAANWSLNSVPNGSSDIATFDFSNQTDISISTPTTVAGIVFAAGASGFLSKNADDGELCRAIRAAMRGGRYVSPELAEMLVSGLQGAPGEPRHSVLSEREFQIFCKLAEGKSVSEIAAKLFLSVKTVSTYRTRILEKMAMKTNADITYYAIKNNLLQ